MGANASQTARIRKKSRKGQKSKIRKDPAGARPLLTPSSLGLNTLPVIRPSTREPTYPPASQCDVCVGSSIRNGDDPGFGVCPVQVASVATCPPRTRLAADQGTAGYSCGLLAISDHSGSFFPGNVLGSALAVTSPTDGCRSWSPRILSLAHRSMYCICGSPLHGTI